MIKQSNLRSCLLVTLLTMAGVGGADAQTIQVSSQLPADIPGGAQNATITSAATFAWQEFIALNWPAVQQTGAQGTRGVPSSANFGTDTGNQPVVWETLRGKVETFPGVASPPGYVNNAAQDYGFDALPAYNYGTRALDANGYQTNTGGTPLTVPACMSPTQAPVTNPSFINLDEITQIGLDQMYAGVLPASITSPTASNANAEPQLIRFLAKGNRTFYDYVASNQYWYKNQAYATALNNFSTAAAANTYPAPMPTLTLPTGTVLVKAAWRPLAATETASSFHTKTVRFYDQNGSTNAPCYREQTWALIALHIIQKTPTAPDFIFATFEYANNILTSSGLPVENNNGAPTSNAPTGDGMNPLLQYFDIDKKYYSPSFPQGTTTVTPPSGATLPAVLINGNNCTVTGNAQIYFQDLSSNTASVQDTVCVNHRYFTIPSQIQQVNEAAHTALSTYGAPGLWQNYKLVNVQWQPFDISQIDTTGANTNRLVSTFSLANSVVETDNTLQQFFGGLFGGGSPGYQFFKSAYESFTIADGTAYNIYGPPPANSVPPASTQFSRVNMGGCMGCHGRAERAGADFSFTLKEGPVATPEFGVAANAPGATTTAAATAAASAHFRAGLDQARLQSLRDALGGH